MNSIPLLGSKFYFYFSNPVYWSWASHIILHPTKWTPVFWRFFLGPNLVFVTLVFIMGFTNWWLKHQFHIQDMSRYTINIYIICKLYTGYGVPPPLSSTLVVWLTYICTDVCSSFAVVKSVACGWCHLISFNNSVATESICCSKKKLIKLLTFYLSFAKY